MWKFLILKWHDGRFIIDSNKQKLQLTWKFRKWHRFECEAENEVHVNDNPIEKVSFLLWRRSMLTPMLGHRPEELNSLRNPLQEFSFVHYLQEVLAQYMVLLTNYYYLQEVLAQYMVLHLITTTCRRSSRSTWY